MSATFLYRLGSGLGSGYDETRAGFKTVRFRHKADTAVLRVNVRL